MDENMDKPATLREWCSLIEKARNKHPGITDAQLAVGMCLEGENPDTMSTIVQRVNQYIRIRDILRKDPNWDAEGLAEEMCKHPVMAASFLGEHASDEH